MSNAEYAFMSAYLKGAEARMVTPDHINRLSRNAAVPDVMEAIRDTEVGGYLETASVKTFDDSDRCLWQYFGRCLERLEALRLMPDDMCKVLNAYKVRYDIINIKAVLQSIPTGKQANLIPVGVIHMRGLLDELARAASVDAVIRLLVECGLGTYASVIREYDTGNETGLKLQMEAGLDGEYYKNLLDTAKDVEDGFILAKTFGLSVDLINLKIVSRAVIEEIGAAVSGCIITGGYLLSSQAVAGLLSGKLADIPNALGGTPYRVIADEVVAGYNRSKSITAVEEIIDRHRFQLLKEMLSPRVMSPLVIAWYLTVAEVEIRNLRLIMKAAFDGISTDEIKEYLVF
ncbi:MAG: V-type ATPase subunit [Dehalococcoidales bacterium]|nr:V-type ATPase subunit [Dehalococcoidales bacterium]